MKIYKTINSRSKYNGLEKGTLRSAPALELNLVEVMIRLFRGSIAPIDTSGVSSIATNLGGAVKIAALPYLTGKTELGVPTRGDMGPGVVGVRGLLMLNRSLAPIEDLEPETEVTREGRLGGVPTDEVERARIEVVRLRKTDEGWRPLAESGVLGLEPIITSNFDSGLSSPSVHCKCKMMDLVAHYTVARINTCVQDGS